jgi:radical SAM protein with 4Fe4S-binding SPASM domain
MKNALLPKLDLNITNDCNFRCVHCAFDSGIKKYDELSLPTIKKILTQTRRLGGERIDITGGEPTLRKDLPQIIKFGKKLGFRIELVTNGSLLNRTRLVQFKKMGLDAIAISLDGIRYATYARIRKTKMKTFRRVLETIHDSVNLGFYTKINTVAFTTNLHEIPEITEFCIKNRIHEHGIYYFTPVGRGKTANSLVIPPIRWLDFMKKELLPLQSNIKISIEFPFSKNNELLDRAACIAQYDRHHLQILPNGDVFPCAIMASYDKPIANLHERSIPQIWNNNALWNAYWQKNQSVFNANDGCCVDLNKKCINNTIRKKNHAYHFICPLRKFHVSDAV